MTPYAVAESVEHWSRVREVVGSNLGQVKPMTFQKETIAHMVMLYHIHSAFQNFNYF